MTDLYRALTLSGWLGAVAGLTLAAGAVLLLALVADFALARRVSARWRSALYVAVFLRLALPATWASPLGLLSRSPAPPPVRAAVVETVAHENGDIRHFRASPAAQSALPVFSLLMLGVAASLAAAAGATRLVARRALRDARPASPRLAALAGGVPALLLEHPTRGPAVYGLVRPRIVVPSPLVARLDDDALGAVLRHEAAHVTRRDPWRLALLQLATIAAWPILPAWVAAWRVRGLMEQACDEAALREAGAAQRRAYGEALLAVADWQPLRSRLALGMLSFGGGLAPRLRALRFTRRWPALAQVVLVALFASATVLASGERVASDGSEIRAIGAEADSVTVLVETHAGAARLPVPEGTALASIGDGERRWVVLSVPTRELHSDLPTLEGRATWVTGRWEQAQSWSVTRPGTSDVPLSVRWTPRRVGERLEIVLGRDIRSHEPALVSGTSVMRVTHSRTDDSAFAEVPVPLDEGQTAVLALQEAEGTWTLLSFTPLRGAPAAESRGDALEIDEGLRRARELLDGAGGGDASVLPREAGRIDIQGRCASPLELARILRSFEDSRDFADVALERQTTEPATGGTTFQFSARWRPASELESLAIPDWPGDIASSAADIMPLLSPRGDVQVDHRARSVIVRDTSERLDDIRRRVLSPAGRIATALRDHCSDVSVSEDPDAIRARARCERSGLEAAVRAVTQAGFSPNEVDAVPDGTGVQVLFLYPIADLRFGAWRVPASALATLVPEAADASRPAVMLAGVEASAMAALQRALEQSAERGDAETISRPQIRSMLGQRASITSTSIPDDGRTFRITATPFSEGDVLHGIIEGAVGEVTLAGKGALPMILVARGPDGAVVFTVEGSLAAR